MTPYYTSERAVFYNGDCRVVMAEMEENSVDSIVCDPPYEINFMSKSFDRTGIAHDVKMWQEALRVLKPGGYLLAFGATRTYHRLACAVEDAGFECRDACAWLHGQGFPKNLNISKNIDKTAGAEREVIGTRKHPTLKNTDLLEEQANAAHGGNTWSREWDVTASTTDSAKQWDGWGTALKPSMELIVVARKPLSEKTVAANVLKYGTGAINIDACRIAGEPVPINKLEQWSGFGQEKRPEYEQEISTLGRWPSNVCHDGSEEVLALFPDTGNSSVSLSPDKYYPKSKQKLFGGGMGGEWHPGFGDEGSAARFFYCAKTSGEDRHEGMDGKNDHPCVKPTSLMRYLCRLVTRPGGTVLDPFTGSGSTCKGAILEGFKFIGVEISEEYCEIAKLRIIHAIENDHPLFAESTKTVNGDDDPMVQNNLSF